LESPSRVTPFQRFCNGLHSVRADFNESLDEMLAFAEIMARKQNSVELDENGFFYVTAAGPLDEIIPVMHKQLEKLERIKKQRDNQH
jgi:hypothetical protein